MNRSTEILFAAESHSWINSPWTDWSNPCGISKSFLGCYSVGHCTTSGQQPRKYRDVLTDTTFAKSRGEESRGEEKEEGKEEKKGDGQCMFPRGKGREGNVPQMKGEGNVPQRKGKGGGKKGRGRGTVGSPIIRQVSERTKGKLTATLKSAGHFSTTGRDESMAASVAILQTVDSYFDYEVRTRCGIRAVTLEGVPEDWTKLRLSVDALPLESLDLGNWRMPLQEIMLYLEATALGKGLIDSSSMSKTDFWKSIYKYQSCSGGDSCTGWILFLFPALGKDWMERQEARVNCRERLWMPSRGKKGKEEFEEPTSLKQLLKAGYNNRPCRFKGGLAATDFVWKIDRKGCE